MTDLERRRIAELRAKGYGYTRISEELDIKLNTVKAYCKRHGLGGIAEAAVPETVEKKCQCCGKDIISQKGRKEKKFCSDRCRNAWWNDNLDMVNRKAIYEFTCSLCKKPFTAYGNKNRKYCSRECYLADRFGRE